ncbi:MAG: META domain-containing protein [Bacteroidales bacterium]|jgi:heat shock protein HslJ|nr:META domain-containing protein [Bacteroidales bacterium]
MKVLLKSIGIIAVVLSLGSCKTTSDMHSSQNSLDWSGIYKGTIPEGEGKELVAMLTLEPNSTYTMESAITYDDRKTTESKGTFSWKRSGNEIELKDGKTGKKTVFRVGENRLTGKIGTSPITMTKFQKETITEKYWKLIELNGKPVVVDQPGQREAFMVLHTEGNRVHGNGSCNSFNGMFELENMNRIKFSKMAATMMACINMETEIAFMKTLEMVDNYTLSADGKHLSLNRARMAPLARFEVVYLR